MRAFTLDSFDAPAALRSARRGSREQCDGRLVGGAEELLGFE